MGGGIDGAKAKARVFGRRFGHGKRFWGADGRGSAAVEGPSTLGQVVEFTFYKSGWHFGGRHVLNPP